jgi:transcriptional regulator of arginine metabolism
MKADRTAARRRLVREILARHRVGNQAELLDHLERHGHNVTQATVSRDLAAIGAEKLPSPSGADYYVVGELEQAWSRRQLALIDALRSYLVGLSSSDNLLVIRTVPAGAGPVAAAIDAGQVEGVVGTIAGDDTVLVVAGSHDGGDALEKRFSKMVGGR